MDSGQKGHQSCRCTWLALLAIPIVVSLMLGGCGLLSQVQVRVSPGTITVCPSGCDYTSIQAAIGAAHPYQVIEVQTGSYRESLVIVKPLTLKGVGADGTVIESESEESPAITVIAGEVVISGFSITGEHDGVKVEGDSGATIRDCKVKGNRFAGIVAQDRAEVCLEESDISGNGRGVFAEGHSKFTVRGGYIWFNRYEGILLREAAELTLIFADVSLNSSDGIWASDYTWLSLKYASVDSNRGDGVLLADHATAQLEENSIVKNGGWGVATYEWPCHMTEESFSGTVRGRGNEIPDRWEEDGNKKGALCGVPQWLRD